VLLDGAHNPAGAAALAQALDDLRPYLHGAGAVAGATDAADNGAPLLLVHGSMGDKDVDGIIEALAGSEALAGARVITTQVPGERAMPAAELAKRWRTLRPDTELTVVVDPGSALDRALAVAHGPVVVAGSLYLVGEARRRWVDDPLLHDPGEVAT